MSFARKLVFLPAVLATLGSAAPAAWAEWPSNPNDNVPLCTAAGQQVTPVIASDGAGGAIVAWEDHRSGTESDIYAQRVNGAGVLMWPDGGYDGVGICTKLNNQERPTIISDGAGGAIVTWHDLRRGGAGTDIYVQRVNADGVTQWTPGGVAICTSPNDQFYPTIASDGAGGGIIAWQDGRGGATNSVYAQRVDSAGVPRWADNGVALCTAVRDQIHPRIVSDGAGGAIVTWDDFRSGPSGTHFNWDVYAQRVNAAGVPQWTADGVALCAAPNEQYEPTILSDGAGGAFVTWSDLRGGTTFAIYAQRVNAAGASLWTTDGVALCTESSGSPAMTSDGASGAIVTWEDGRNGSNDIFAQRVNSAGAAEWTANGVPVSTAASLQVAPMIISDMAGGAIVTWYDIRGSDYDIYAQNINADGTLGGTLLSVPILSVATSFALHGVQPNPSFGELRVSFSLSDGTPAMLEVFDLTGRRIESRSVGGLGAGTHVASLAPRAALAPGVYCVSLTQGSRRAFSKVTIVR